MITRHDLERLVDTVMFDIWILAAFAFWDGRSFLCVLVALIYVIVDRPKESTAEHHEMKPGSRHP